MLRSNVTTCVPPSLALSGKEMAQLVAANQAINSRLTYQTAYRQFIGTLYLGDIKRVSTPRTPTKIF